MARKWLPNRPWTRRILLATGVFLTITLTAIVAVRVLLATGPGRAFVEARLEGITASGVSVEIDGLDGDLLGGFAFDRLSLKDREGVFATIDNAQLDWSPMTILARTLRIDNVEADAITLLRQPVIESSQSQSSGGGSSHLRRYILGNLQVDLIEIADTVAGREAIFTLNAQAEAGGANGTAKIRLTPIAGTDDRLLSDLTWSVEGGLSGDLDVYFAAGGAIAQAIGLPSDQDLTARLSARGDLDAWKLDASATLGGVDVIVLDASRRSENLAATGTVNLAALDWVSPALSRFGERLEIEAGTRAENVTVTARTDQVSLSADAPWPVPADLIETEGLDFVLELSDSADLLPTEVGDIGPVTLAGRVRRGGETWRFDGTLGANDLSVSGYGVSQVSGPLLVSLGPETLDVDTNLSVRGVTGLPDAALLMMGDEAQISARAAYTLASQNLFLSQAEFFTPATQATAQGSAQFAAPMNLDLSGDLVTEALSDMSGGRAQRANLNWTVRQAAGEAQRITVQGDVAGLAGLPFPAAQWLGEQVGVEAEVSLAEAGPLIERLALGGERLDLLASGTIDGQSMNLDASLQAEPVSDAGLSLGALALNGRLDGTFDAFAFNVDAALQSAELPGAAVEGLNLQTSGRRSVEGVDGRLDVTAMSAAGQPLALSTELGIGAPLWRVGDLDLDWGTLNATADLSGSFDNLLAVDGAARITGQPPFDGLPFSAIEADLTATNGALNLDAVLEGLALAGFTLPEATISANGTPDQLNYSAAFSGTGEIRSIQRDVRAQLTGEATQGPDGLVTLTSLDGALGEMAFATSAPVRVALSDGLEANGSLSLLGGDLDFAYATAAGQRLTLNSTSLELTPVFDLLARPGLTGTAQILVDLASDGTGPLRGNSSLTLNGLDSTEIEAPQIDGVFNAALSDNGLNASANLSGEEGLAITAQAIAASSADGLLGFDASTMQVSAQGSGPLATLWTYAGPEGTALTGDFNLSSGIQAGGAIQADLTIDGATFEHGTLGLFLTDLDVAAGFSEGRVTLDALSARGREGGTVSGSGAMTLGETGRFEVNLSDLVALRRRGLSATVSGNVAYEMGETRNEVSGDISIDQALFSLEALPTARPQTLNVVFRSPETGEIEEERPDPTPTYLDIKLSAPQELFVRGQGVNAELGADATISGTIVKPEIGGIARVVRGNVDFLGKQFDFVDSTVTIAGDPMDARLDLTAEYEASDFTAQINVTGTPFRPEISMSGSPDLPEDQVLSRVLFGRSPAELSALEAAQLAAALSQLAGGGSGFSLTGSLQDSLGLDRVNLGQNADGSASLATGKYLAEDLYLELETTGSGSPGVSLEWTPLNNVEVGTTIDPVEGPEFSVRWKRDYD